MTLGGNATRLLHHLHIKPTHHTNNNSGELMSLNPRSGAAKLLFYMKKRLPTSPNAPLHGSSSAPLSVTCRRNNKAVTRASSEGNNNIKKKKNDYFESKGEEMAEECSAREKLQRYRMQVAGSVWIPDVWDQEERLKEWTDPKVVDRCLAPDGLLSARSALIRDCNANTIKGMDPPVIPCSQ